MLCAITASTVIASILHTYANKLLFVHAMEHNYRTPFSHIAGASVLVLVVASIPIYLALKLRRTPKAEKLTMLTITIALPLEFFLPSLLTSFHKALWLPSIFLTLVISLWLAHRILNQQQRPHDA